MISNQLISNSGFFLLNIWGYMTCMKFNKHNRSVKNKKFLFLILFKSQKNIIKFSGGKTQFLWDFKYIRNF